jgi:hemerythrin superfamily protein
MCDDFQTYEGSEKARNYVKDYTKHEEREEKVAVKRWRTQR